MPYAPWKAAETDLAKFFNTTRRPLSGLNQGTGRGDDCQHERLYLEAKYGQGKNVSWIKQVFDLFTTTRQRAAKEAPGTIPIIGLKKHNEKRLNGLLLVVSTSDLEALSIEYLTQLGYEILDNRDEEG